jgi:MFS transporter, ACS family, hexuronate transporter
VPRPIKNLRWWIGGLLFASTVVNYIDRQTLAALAPFLKAEYKWSYTEFASILLAFRVAYTVGQSVSGWLLDRLGTRKGLTITVAAYSAVAALTSLAQGIWSFRGMRFLLGSTEAANWPGATKAVSEWFPARERAWAVALFDSGSAIGGAVAPFVVLWLYRSFGSWRPAFLITAMLGFIWLIFWRKMYHAPEDHPRISPEELDFIRKGRFTSTHDQDGAPPVRWAALLRYRQTWGIVLARGFMDPYWFLVSEWFALFLVSRGFSLEQSVLGFWAPFMGADLGNFAGAALSSWLIRRGMPVGPARRRVVAIFGPSMLVLVPVVFSSNYLLLILTFAYATFAYAACSTICLSLPADVFHTRVVASVSGMSGTAAGLATLVSTYFTGVIADRFGFQPVIIAASAVPCLATLIIFALVRPRKTPDPAGLVQEF